MNFIFMLKGWIEFVFYSIKSILKFIFDSIASIFYFIAQCLIFPFRLLNRLFSLGLHFRRPNKTAQKPRKDDTKQKSRMEEELRRAREEVRQAREQAKKKEAKPNTDNDGRSHQEILGLSATFTEPELKQAYRLAVSRYHPDKYAHMSKAFQEEAGREFVKIQQAYNALIKNFS
ncbi:J domain-containing protein [Methylovulum psychrotolerans]|uniref:J domain-containing protein n=1 Tax=Methylovulum psychrotolerans TaxID=1704499 RepID=UPI0018DF4C46|nr:J domain-containing protein [Methylovulum psychrotolerans]